MAISDSLIIELDSIDSTNNYAMQLIDANKAQHGLTITARRQEAGKGQRGKSWVGIPGQSLLMSVVVHPGRAISEQFVFNSSIAVSVVAVLKNICPEQDFYIKWPNDIIVNDKKAGGILIENVLRGTQWTHSVVGIGLNINQENFPGNLPFATSLKIVSGKEHSITKLRDGLTEDILINTVAAIPGQVIMNLYNKYLYRRGQKQAFTDGKEQWDATIRHVHTDGLLEVALADGTLVSYYHGQVEWVWG